jgi:hypothetical protein
MIFPILFALIILSWGYSAQGFTPSTQVLVYEKAWESRIEAKLAKWREKKCWRGRWGRWHCHKTIYW